MEWLAVLQSNFGAIIAVLGTIGGGIVGASANFFTHKSIARQDYFRDHILLPVNSYIDELLTQMDAVYWLVADAVSDRRRLSTADPLISARLDAFRSIREKHMAIRARIESLDSQDLSKEADRLFAAHIRFRNLLRDFVNPENTGDPTAEMQLEITESIAAASKVQRKLRRI